MSRSSLVSSLLAGCAALSVLGVAHAAFPDRPVRLIVPYAAGGITDQVGRQLAELMAAELGQPVIVENKPGANGTMGATLIKNAAADGYTLTMAPVGVFRQPYMQKTPFDPVQDFTYVSRVAGYSSAIGVPADSAYQSLQDLIEAARRPGALLSYGTSGTYSTHHLAMVMLGAETGAQWTHIPFKGDSEAITSMLGRNTEVTVVANTMRPFVDDKRIRILATFGESRSADYPAAPTAQEQGYKVVMASPFGIIGPKGMAEDVVGRLDAAVASALQQPRFKAFADQVGLNLMYQDSAAYTAYAKEAFAQEKVILETAGVPSER